MHITVQALVVVIVLQCLCFYLDLISLWARAVPGVPCCRVLNVTVYKTHWGGVYLLRFSRLTSFEGGYLQTAPLCLTNECRLTGIPPMHTHAQRTGDSCRRLLTFGGDSRVACCRQSAHHRVVPAS